MNFNPSLSPGSPQIVAGEVSSEQLNSLVTQIEEELHSSQVYTLSIESFQKVLGYTASKGEILIRAVGREAIQIALRQMARGYVSMANTVQSETAIPTQAVEQQSSVETPQLTVGSESGLSGSINAPSQQTDSEAMMVVSSLGWGAGECTSKSQYHLKSTPPTPHPKVNPAETSDPSPQKKGKKRTKADLRSQKIQQRTDYLQEVGQQFRQARIASGLSQCELHRQTMVPLTHLEALETADEAQLPEDVYLRGFICRLGNALGLDGTAMAAALPSMDPVQSLQPSWSPPEPETGFYLNSIHLYLGYAALVAGSLGGIAWLSQQSLPENKPIPDVPEIPTQTSPQSYQPVEPELTPGLQTTAEGIILGRDLAQPEVSPAEVSPA